MLRMIKNNSNPKKPASRRLKGFTLIEMVIVVLIFGIIFAGVLALVEPITNQYRNTAKYEDARSNIDNVRFYLEEYLRFADRMHIYTGVEKMTDLDDLMEHFNDENNPLDFHIPEKSDTEEIDVADENGNITKVTVPGKTAIENINNDPLLVNGGGAGSIPMVSYKVLNPILKYSDYTPIANSDKKQLNPALTANGGEELEKRLSGSLSDYKIKVSALQYFLSQFALIPDNQYRTVYAVNPADLAKGAGTDLDIFAKYRQKYDQGFLSPYLAPAAVDPATEEIYTTLGPFNWSSANVDVSSLNGVTVKRIEVNFNSAGGFNGIITVNGNSLTLDYGTSLMSYSFDINGALNSLTTTAWDAGNGITFTVDVIVEKSEGPTYHTVTFNSDGGTVIAPVIVESGQTVSRPADPTRADGWNFDGWYNGDDLFDFSSPINGDITLTAHWSDSSITKYAVTFVLDGGTAEWNTQQDVPEGGKVTRPSTDPTRTDYRFTGWFTDNSLETEFDFENTLITGGINIYAGWEEISEEIDYWVHTYHHNNGANPDSHEVRPKRTEGGYGPPDPPASPGAGYTFEGWYDNPEFTGERLYYINYG
ncbi:MAG: InlB B-repeat-containing protein, partial [Oscillospiraceae bacterium]|nr:InlB B-repeat-containing protein [Oscillospiraceae bacterium]